MNPEGIPEGVEFSKLHTVFYFFISNDKGRRTIIAPLLMDDLETVGLVIHGYANPTDKSDLTPDRYFVVNPSLQLQRADADGYDYAMYSQIEEAHLSTWMVDYGNIPRSLFP